MRPLNHKSIIFGIIGLILALMGTCLSFVWPQIFKDILRSELPLTPTSRAFEIWRDSSGIPMNMEFYFFNWTNPEELMIKGKKPNFEQVGPYTFREQRQKVNITFHPENNTVTYQQKRFWFFDPDKSNGTLEDKIIQLNVVAVSAAHKVRYWTYFMQQTLSHVLHQFSNSLHVVRTVDELLFTGYEDKVITLGQMTVGDDDEEIPPFDRFGWFYKRNGSTFFDGVLNMATGEDNIMELGVLKHWNYKDVSKYYKSPCNIVEGSAGEFWPPNRDIEDISIFTPDLCRPLTYEYTKTVTHKGIQGFKYTLGEKSLGNNTIRRYPHEQAKYFERTTTTEDFFSAEHTTTTDSTEIIDDPDMVNMGKCWCNGECSPMGVINVTACRYGAPAFVSLPHFYKADPILRDRITGMNPNDDDHDFYITLEPTTGIAIDVAARLQVNILLQPSLTVGLFKDVPKIYFPMFWFNLESGVTDDLAWGVRQLLMLPTAGLYGSIILAVVGALILVIVAIIAFLRNSRSNSKSAKRKIGNTNNKKTELVYMDTTVGNDDHERTDRPLHPRF